MSQVHHSTPLPQGLGIPVSNWRRPPTSVCDEFLSLLKRVDALEARLNHGSSNSNYLPSTDPPAKKRNRQTKAAERRKPGAKPGHRGHRQVLLEPTSTVPLFPEPFDCGNIQVDNLTTYHAHQVIELPDQLLCDLTL